MQHREMTRDGVPVIHDRDRPLLFEDADPLIWSHVTVRGRKLTWRELYEQTAERLRRAEELLADTQDPDAA